MMNYFLNLSVRNQITVLLSFMGAGIVIFSTSVIIGNWSTYSENKALAELVGFSVKSSSLVHEMQKERGMTAGFSKSRGKKFAQDLPKQRRHTDAKQGELFSYVRENPSLRENVEFNERLGGLVKSMAGLKEIRTRVDSFSITPAKAIGYYTNTNNNFLDIIAFTRKESHDATLLLQISSYVNFLLAKENAGIERAVGAGGFLSGFSIEDLEKFNKLITAQSIYFTAFRSTATSGDKELVRAAFDNQALKDVDRMRGIARSSYQTGDTQGIDSEYWFAQMTKKINILKKLEDEIATDLFEAVETKEYNALYLLLFVATFTLLSLGAVFYLAATFATELSACFEALKFSLIKGAGGDLEHRIEGITSKGEMKEVQELTNKFMEQTDVFINVASACMDDVSQEKYAKKMPVDNFQGAFLLSAKTINAAVDIAKYKAGELEGLMQKLEATVKTVVKDTLRIATDMKTTSTSMLSLSNESVDKSDQVDKAATTSQEGAINVASAVEELSASINQISTQAESSSQIVAEAQENVENVTQVVESFGEEVDNIGNVVELIKDIAEQTNLLALNATVESARAGEAGKGFAVVASEVKNLAGQTAKATEDIARQIGAIQAGSKKIFSGVKNIGVVMTKVSQISNEMTASVEEQNAATQEISGNMQRTSENVNDVKNNIGGIKKALTNTVSSASDVMSMTDDLSGNVAQLNAALDSVMGKTA